MLIFRTDPSSPDGWSRLERCVMLGIHAGPRSATRFCFSGKIRYREYLNSRRIPILKLSQYEGIPKTDFLALVMDCREWNETDLRMVGDFKKAGVPVLAVKDPGDPETPQADWVLGGSLMALGDNAPPGMDWALLHPRFRHFHHASRFYHHQVRNILIHLEDRICYRRLRRIVDTLYRHGYRIRIGPMPGIKKNLKRALSRRYPRIRWTGKVECMARAMTETDIAVIAPGNAAFEAAASGTPAFYFSSSDAEARAALNLESKGLGKAIPLTCETIPIDLIPTLSRRARTDMGKKGKDLVDGMGLFRTIDFLRKQHIITDMQGDKQR